MVPVIFVTGSVTLMANQKPRQDATCGATFFSDAIDTSYGRYPTSTLNVTWWLLMPKGTMEGRPGSYLWNGE